MYGTKFSLAVSRLTWHCAPILLLMASRVLRLPLVQNRVIIRIGGVIKVKGLYDAEFTAEASDKAL